MKRWAVVTVFLYSLILVLLTAPLLLFANGGWWGRQNEGITLETCWELYQTWGYWTWLGVMGLGAALLLLVPVDLSQRRQVPRRKLLVPIFTAAFFFANIFFGGLVAFACALKGDNALEYFIKLADDGAGVWMSLALVIALLWAVWAWVFYRVTRADAPEALMARLGRWLLRGSILELLVAIPSHVIVRHKENCCAPLGSFWGIATGLTVMLLCFGPGVFFLFAERFAKKQVTVRKSAKRGRLIR